MHWRALTTLDLPAVEAIAAAVHPDFPEDAAVFAERQRLYPDGARLLELDGEPSGYILSPSLAVQGSCRRSMRCSAPSPPMPTPITCTTWPCCPRRAAPAPRR